jgi:hypothetical protein
MDPADSPERTVHNCHYAPRNKKEVGRSLPEKYGALLKRNKLKLRHNKCLCLCCATENISTFTSQVRQNCPLCFVKVLESGDDHLPT